MSKPTESIDWAEDNVSEYVIDPSTNQSVLVVNKLEPSTDFKLSGIRARSKVTRAYINYILNALSKWVKYSVGGDIGDFRLVAVGTTQTEVETRYGGTWADRGTASLGTATAQVFEKIS